MVSQPGRSLPPRLARALVHLLPGVEDHAFLVADLEEEFDDLAATHGIAAARRWYWKQACLSIVPLLHRRASALLSSQLSFIVLSVRGGKSFMLQNFFTDLRYGWRMSRRAPVVTVSVTLAIALGIAASTAIFSVMEGVFLRPLPFPQPDRLIRFSTAVEHLGLVPEVNYLDAQDWRAASTTLQAIALYDVAPGTVRVA